MSRSRYKSQEPATAYLAPGRGELGARLIDTFRVAKRAACLHPCKGLGGAVAGSAAAAPPPAARECGNALPHVAQQFSLHHIQLHAQGEPSADDLPPDDGSPAAAAVRARARSVLAAAQALYRRRWDDEWARDNKVMHALDALRRAQYVPERVPAQHLRLVASIWVPDLDEEDEHCDDRDLDADADLVDEGASACAAVLVSRERGKEGGGACV